MIFYIEEIAKFLPHRYPFLLLDRVTEVNFFDKDGKLDIMATGYKNVTCNEEFFNGHFPNNPVMPGVLIMEALGQLAAFSTLQYYHNESNSIDVKQNYDVYFVSMDRVKFRGKVVPGDQLILKAKQKRKIKNIWYFDCEAYVLDNKVAEATLAAALVLRD